MDLTLSQYNAFLVLLPALVLIFAFVAMMVARKAKSDTDPVVFLVVSFGFLAVASGIGTLFAWGSVISGVFF